MWVYVASDSIQNPFIVTTISLLNTYIYQYILYKYSSFVHQ